MEQARALGAEAITYIRAQLAEGATLSAYLLALPLEQGRVITFAPPEIPQHALLAFATGGVTARSHTIGRLAQMIADILPGRTASALFEDALARPSDPSLATHQLSFVTYGDEVYYTFQGEYSNRDALILALRKATAHTLLGILTSVELPLHTAENPQISAVLLQTAAHATTHIFIGAYDGEGMLIWQKP